MVLIKIRLLIFLFLSLYGNQLMQEKKEIDQDEVFHI